MIRFRNHIMICVMAVAVWLLLPMSARAAEASVTFGSDSYENETDAAFPIGVYITSDELIGSYQVLLRYDSLRLEYLSGADEADTEHGILTLSGDNAGISEVKYWLTFRVISGGEANIAVTDAQVYGPGAEGYTITELGYAPISLSGADVAQAVINDAEADEIAEAVDEGEALGEDAEVPEGSSDADNPVVEEETESDTEVDEKPGIFLNPLIAVGIPFVVIIVVAEILLLAYLRRRDKAKRHGRMHEAPEDIEAIIKHHEEVPLPEEEFYPEIDYETENRLREERGEPVISVYDVTMEFKLYKNVPSGIKEYLIQLVRREVTYRRLYALYHVSFDVFKGEVVGIIGTNGSGKSTVLKIVSGALSPTSGEVSVDRGKLQILTLGTGFDMELSARENVYLNGAIIGYSKEFIDEHYDEIVDFAELWDFMDEKVKNFSSGMVSRLGFAIATAGDAAEILILDEVLSVGDEFFRKKSLERIKEMIHGGSTVLMVSHGLGTIIEHCTKAIWIEKGQLRMIGAPKTVCAAYQKLGKE